MTNWKNLQFSFLTWDTRVVLAVVAGGVGEVLDVTLLCAVVHALHAGHHRGGQWWW